MWIIYIKEISDKFTPSHIFSNLLCYSPFSYETYNNVDPFGMVYNEIIFFFIGVTLIFYSYKKCLRLDIIVICLSIVFFLIKLGIGSYYIFYEKDENILVDTDDYKKRNHGFYPLMFYQYNDDLRIKSFLLSNQIFNISSFLLGILFGEMNYCIQNFAKANDKSKRYLVLPKKALNCFTKMKNVKYLFFILFFALFALCVFTYEIIIFHVNMNKSDDFFLEPINNLIGLVDTDIGVIFYFLCITILLLSGDHIIVNFLKNKYWGILSRTYWMFLLCLHMCASHTFYFNENRIKLSYYNVFFFGFEIFMELVIVIAINYICVEIPLKKINKIFIKNRDEKLLGFKK
jgi:hypothetical protein